MACLYVQAQPDTASFVRIEKQVIRKIIIEGNKRTRDRIILREMSVAEGDTLSKGKLPELLEINRQRIFNLPLFTEVIVSAVTVNDSTIDWLVKVREQWYILPEVTIKLADRNINTWIKEQGGDIRRANFGVAFKHRNFRGNLETLSAIVQIGYTQKLGLEYFKPYIDKKQQHGLGASFFYSQNEETFYTTDKNKWRFVKKPGIYIIRSFEAATRYVHRPGYANKHTVEMRYRSMRANDTIMKLNNDYYLKGSNRLQLLELTYRYDLNRVDNWNYPTTGLKVVGSAGFRVGIQGFDFQSYVSAEVGYFKCIGRKWLFSEILRGRLTLPDDPPYVFRYAMGNGSEYVRGYEYYVIDGTQYGLLRTNLKYELVNTAIRNFPIRYLAVIPIRIYPKIFADVGYAANPQAGTSFLNNRGLAGYGFGVDIVSAYDFKLRLEYTFNHLGQKGLFLHTNSE
jgi:outer membrane protein assembly factor BamA